MDYSTLENCLFGAVKLTKIADIDKYGYSSYGIGFRYTWIFFIPFWRNCQKCNNFWSRYDLSTKIDNRKKDILIPGTGPTQGLEHKFSAEKAYSIKFIEKKKQEKFV